MEQEKATEYGRQIESLLALQPEDPRERRRFQDKLDGLVLLALAGKLDIATFAAREMAASRKEAEIRLALERLRRDENELRLRESELAGAQAGLEKELEAERQRSRDQLIALEERAQKKIDGAERMAEEAQASRQAAWLQERAALLVRIEDLQARGESRESDARDMKARLAAFKESAAQQRELDERAQERFRLAEERLEETQASLQKSWLQERQSLLQEMERLRAQAERAPDAPLGAPSQEQPRNVAMPELESAAEELRAGLREKTNELADLRTTAARESGALRSALALEQWKSRELENRFRDMDAARGRKEQEFETALETLREAARRREAEWDEILAQKEKAIRDQRELVATLEERADALAGAGQSAAGAVLRSAQMRIVELESALAAAKQSASLALAPWTEHECAHEREIAALRAEAAEREKTSREALAQLEKTWSEALAQRVKTLSETLARQEKTSSEELAQREKTWSEVLAQREKASSEESALKDEESRSSAARADALEKRIVQLEEELRRAAQAVALEVERRKRLEEFFDRRPKSGKPSPPPLSA